MHLACDGAGRPLAFALTGGNTSDCKAFESSPLPPRTWDGRARDRPGRRGALGRPPRGGELGWTAVAAAAEPVAHPAARRGWRGRCRLVAARSGCRLRSRPCPWPHCRPARPPSKPGSSWSVWTAIGRHLGLRRSAGASRRPGLAAAGTPVASGQGRRCRAISVSSSMSNSERR